MSPKFLEFIEGDNTVLESKSKKLQVLKKLKPLNTRDFAMYGSQIR